MTEYDKEAVAVAYSDIIRLLSALDWRFSEEGYDALIHRLIKSTNGYSEGSIEREGLEQMVGITMAYRDYRRKKDEGA